MTFAIQTWTTAALLATGLALPAAAGNLDPVAPTPVPVAPPAPVAPAYDWTGFFAGASIGFADTDLDGPAGSLEGEGELLGLRAGYDFDLGGFVLGGAVSFDTTNIELSGPGGTAEVDNILRVGARAGLDRGRNLFYGTAGYARADADIAGNADGYFAGLGYEVFVTEQITLGAEALHHEFDDFDDAPGLDGDATSVSLNANFRF